LEFWRFSGLEDRFDLGAGLRRQFRAHCWLGFEQFSGFEIPHSRNRTLSSDVVLVYTPNKRN
jgi:hypothetical protein